MNFKTDIQNNMMKRCQGWQNPSGSFYTPIITTLSNFISPAGSNTLITIDGINFFSYSIVLFGNYYPTTYFINSNAIQFYIPNNLNSGIFPIQVFNGTIGSNIINYEIDNASGYWLLNTNGTITNTNQNTVVVSSLSKGIPIVISDINYNNITTPYNIPYNINWIVCDVTNVDIYILLPNDFNQSGREITIRKNGNNIVYSTLTNIINISSLSDLTNIILNTTDIWVTLVYYGNSWIIMQSN